MSPQDTPSNPFTRGQTALFLAVLLAVGVAILSLGQVALAASPPVWGRSFAQGDTLRVPVRWTPSCDALGCADAYRVTWAVDYSNGQTAAVVVRDTTLTRSVDTASVTMPKITQPATVCLYVVAVRRGLASEATNACRTIEAPDFPPPPIDSIVWDSLGVLDATRLLDSLDGNRFSVLTGSYQYRTRRDSLTNRIVTDSALVGIDTVANGVARYTVQPSWTTQFCGMMPHRFENVPVVIVPKGPFTRAQVGAYMDQCGKAAARDYGTAPRFVRDSLSFTFEKISDLNALPLRKDA